MIKLKSLITELTQKQKELKKNYLFNQSKLHSSNTVPSWSQMWKSIQNSDGFNRMLNHMRSELEYKTGTDEEFNEKQVIEQIEDEQRHKYFEVVDEYKHLDGQQCWREIVVPRTINPIYLNQLGVYWAIVESAAEAHWATHIGQPSFKCIYKAYIDLDVMDWTGTMFARMDYTLGESEMEIRFLKNAKIFVESVIVYDNLKDGMNRYEINKERRT